DYLDAGAGGQLTSPPRLDLTVAAHRAVGDELARLRGGLGGRGELEELAQAHLNLDPPDLVRSHAPIMPCRGLRARTARPGGPRPGPSRLDVPAAGDRSALRSVPCSGESTSAATTCPTSPACCRAPRSTSRPRSPRCSPSSRTSA